MLLFIRTLIKNAGLRTVSFSLLRKLVCAIPRFNNYHMNKLALYLTILIMFGTAFVTTITVLTIKGLRQRVYFDGWRDGVIFTLRDINFSNKEEYYDYKEYYDYYYNDQTPKFLQLPQENSPQQYNPKGPVF